MASPAIVRVLISVAIIAGIPNEQASVANYCETNTLAQQPKQDTILQTKPPLMGFYAKYLDCEGIPIRSVEVVDNEALYIAAKKIRMMLMHTDIATKNLMKAGAELHIIGKDQQTSDLPEFIDQKGVNYVDRGVTTDIDKRTRGTGGLFASCGEENLLQLTADRYYGGDICVHEFAHTIMSYGLDKTIRQKIQDQYKNAIKSGLWKNVYASTNAEEYWAELSMWYFGSGGEHLQGTNIPNAGRLSLSNYDNSGYKLLDSIYSGLMQPEPMKRISMAVMKGAVSGPSTEPSELKLINNRSSAVKLYWIDYSGNAKLFATVPPKGRVTQATFVSHVWMMEDNKGRSLGYIRVNDPPCEIQLNDE